MNIFKSAINRFAMFFHRDLPAFFAGQSAFIRFLFIIGAILGSIILLPLLFIGAILVFISIMQALSGNKTYELLYPTEEIAYVEVIHIDEHALYSSSICDLPGILDAQTTWRIRLDTKEGNACIADLQQLSASTWWNDPSPSIKDGVLLIVYSDGSREWICAHGSFFQDISNNESHMTNYYFDTKDFSLLLENYGYQSP